MTAYEHDEHIEQALRVKADGFVTKNEVWRRGGSHSPRGGGAHSLLAEVMGRLW